MRILLTLVSHPLFHLAPPLTPPPLGKTLLNFHHHPGRPPRPRLGMHLKLPPPRQNRRRPPPLVIAHAHPPPPPPAPPHPPVIPRLLPPATRLPTAAVAHRRPRRCKCQVLGVRTVFYSYSRSNPSQSTPP